MRNPIFALAMILAAFLAGCATPTFPVTGSDPDLVLDTPQERTLVGYMAGDKPVKFPAGRYVAAYRTKNGTVYRTTAAIFHGGSKRDDAGILILDAGGQAFQFDEQQATILRLSAPLDFAPR